MKTVFVFFILAQHDVVKDTSLCASLFLNPYRYPAHFPSASRHFPLRSIKGVTSSHWPFLYLCIYLWQVVKKRKGK